MLKFDITKAVIAGTIGLGAVEAYLTHSKTVKNSNEAAAKEFALTTTKVFLMGCAIFAGLHFFRPIPVQEVARTMNIMKYIVVAGALYAASPLFSQVLKDTRLSDDNQKMAGVLGFFAVSHSVVAVSYHTFKVMGFMQGGSLLGRQLAQYGIPFIAGWLFR